MSAVVALFGAAAVMVFATRIYYKHVSTPKSNRWKQSWIDQQLAGRSKDELRATAKFYYQACVATEHEISELVCETLGWEKDPEYGYPTGDHVAITLVEQLAEKYKQLRLAEVRPNEKVSA